VLGTALWRALDGQERVTRYCPATIDALEHRPDHVILHLAGAGSGTAFTGAPAALSARLVVAADGAQSMVRQAIGIDATVRDYAQTAIITNILSGRFHEQVAYERFTAAGPLAILPLTDGRCTVVWTLEPAEAVRIMALDDDAFLERLQDCFGLRLGRFQRVGKRHAYPLALTLADRQVGERVVIIGNAAQGLHPVAGQGFNLGLRDVATLAEVIADAMDPANGRADVGAAQILERYAEWRRTDRRAVVAFTDGLVRLFSNPWAPVRVARSLGLLLFDLNPTAKGLLSRLSTGAAGRMPRLARGLPLSAARRVG
jgi:2-octaprenyl-6-methoxyphenol hydroxylase